jgi:hypothetical protein
LAALMVAAVASPSFAYGKENYQIAFAGTGTSPGTGFGAGFWGWCALGGGTTSGNTGDCEFAEYVHGGSGTNYTCQLSLDLTAWTIGAGLLGPHDFLFTGTATVHPGSLTPNQMAACLQGFELTSASTTFSNVDSGIPAAPGHYSLANVLAQFFGTTRNEFQIQVTALP